MLRKLVALVGVAAVAGGGLVAIHLSGPPPEPPRGPLVFDGESTDLRHTAVVPTLDTPIPDGKSAVWCALFHLAWDKLKSDVVRGPVEVSGAADLCDRLNQAPFAAGDLPPDGYYAAAGRERDGIVDTIAAAMTRRFPSASMPALTPVGDPAAVHAFGYLQAAARFTLPYYANPKPFTFQMPGGKLLPVRSFGIPRVDGLYVDHRVADQPEVLFEERGADHQVTAFAVDPDRTSRPIQLVLARTDRRSSLAATLAHVEEQIRSSGEKSGQPIYREVGHNETLLVPEMSWKVHHVFAELTGADKSLTVDGDELRGVRAEQLVLFHLDLYGARVESGAHIEVKSAAAVHPRRLEFDRPFLLYLKKRDADRPFFVLWVDNAELLCPAET